MANDAMGHIRLFQGGALAIGSSSDPFLPSTEMTTRRQMLTERSYLAPHAVQEIDRGAGGCAAGGERLAEKDPEGFVVMGLLAASPEVGGVGWLMGRGILLRGRRAGCKQCGTPLR